MFVASFPRLHINCYSKFRPVIKNSGGSHAFERSAVISYATITNSSYFILGTTCLKKYSQGNKCAWNKERRKRRYGGRLPYSRCPRKGGVAQCTALITEVYFNDFGGIFSTLLSLAIKI